MKVLVTGGSGVVGRAAVDRLVDAGHRVRLLSRHAERDARAWGDEVEPWPADVGDEGEVRGAAEGCAAVLHLAAVVEEQPPEATFRRVNVEGTRHLVREAARAGAGRFVYVSSLGADRGASDYHRSKREAERIVREEFPGAWLVLRPGNVYGPGDRVVSLLLKMVRSLPAVPVVGGGGQPFQPLWAGDLGRALARAVEPDAPARRALDLAGPDVTSQNELLDLLEEITGRNPVRVPIPGPVARAGTRMAEVVGVDLPVTTGQLQMLAEENVLPPGAPDALREVFGVQPTPLSRGLRLLAESLPENLPSGGEGRLERRRYWADLRGSRMDADQLFETIRREFYTLPAEGLLRVGAEGGRRGLDEGETLTLAIPLRGNVQVRVEEIRDRAATCVTLEGHPLSGAIRFLVEEPEPGTLRFEVRSYTRASDVVDRVGMATVGRAAQKATWVSVVEAVAERCGGEMVDGVCSEAETLDDEAAAGVERWVEEVVMRRRRNEGPAATR